MSQAANMIIRSILIFTSKYLYGTGLECKTPLLRSRPSCYNCAPILFYQGFQFGDRVSQTLASSHCFLSKTEHKLHGQKVRKAVKENLTSVAMLEPTNTFLALFDRGWPPLHVCLKLDIWKAGNEIWKTERGGELLRRGSSDVLQQRQQQPDLLWFYSKYHKSCFHLHISRCKNIQTRLSNGI